MNQPLGDKLFDIAILITIGILIAGWILFIFVSVIKWIFPKSKSSIDIFLEKIIDPISTIQRYTLIIALGLLALRFLAGLLGWAPPLI